MSLCNELLSQQQETVNSFIRSLEEEISQNSQQAQRLMQQSSGNLPKSIMGQVEALIAKEQQNASKLQILEEINKEATEIAEEQHCRLEEARPNLTTPLTSEVEASEAENYGGARPKVKSRAQVTTVTPDAYHQETVAKKYDSYGRARPEQQLEDRAALLRDEVFSVIPGTVNTQRGTASKNRRNGSDYCEDEVFQLPQVPDTPIAGSSHGQKVTFRSPVVRPGSVSSTPRLVPQPVSFDVSRIPDSETSGKDTDSEAVEKLPFKFNLGDVPFSKEQKDHLLNLIYDHQKVFLLHDEDLGFCNKLAHSITTTTDKPVYLPHRTIPRQLQGEVQKCLDTWLRQGIIRSSKSPYASQVVIVRKKTGEIRLCVDYWKLNSIVVRDAFPLPRIDEALQAIHNCQWFMSFDLAQGYLQMPVEEADIPKTAFRAGSSGLYEFTRMPFGLSNSGSSFCRLMEMCLGDQQFVTLLLYLDDICIFAASIDEMLNCIELVFKRLEDFNLKIKPKKCHFFQHSVIFLGHVLSAEGISANPKKVKIGQYQPTQKNYNHFWGWPPTTVALSRNSLLSLSVYTSW